MSANRTIGRVALLLLAISASSAGMSACSSMGATGGADRGGSGGAPPLSPAPGQAGAAVAGAVSSSNAGVSGADAGAPGAGGRSSPAQPPDAGAGGVSDADECATADDCPAPEHECVRAACSAARCTTQNDEAGTTCSAGVCTGEGVCGNCVPAAAKCEDGVPHVCSAEGKWTAEVACGPGSACHGGRCRGVTLDAHLQADSSGTAEIYNLGLDSDGNLYASGTFWLDMAFGGRTLSHPATESSDLFVARLPPSGALAEWVVQIGSSGGEFDSLLAVAANGNHYVGAGAGGALVRGPAAAAVGPLEPHALLVALRGNGVLRSEQSFRAPHSVLTPQTYLKALVPAAEGSGVIALVEFEDAVRWTINAGSGYAELARDGCHTLITELDAQGIPSWTATYDWCNATGLGEQQPLFFGKDGSLYTTGSAGYGSAPPARPTIGTVHPATSSAVLVKIAPADGRVIDVLEIGCSGHGSVPAAASTPEREIAAIVTCTGPGVLTIGDSELPSGVYLMKFNEDFELLDHHAIGGGFPTAIAVNPAGEIFVAGSFNENVDFGTGAHVYRGTCPRCRFGDAFLAGYSPELDLLFDRTYGSAMPERISCLAADASHVYAGLTFGDTVDVEGTRLSPVGSGSAVLLKLRVQ